MPHRATWNASVTIEGGPHLSPSGSVQVEAYDVVTAEVLGGESVTVDVQPASSLDRVELLLITSDRYSENLAYSVTDGVSTGAQDVKLDAPQLMVGAGPIELLGGTAAVIPRQLEFVNGMAADEPANVTILVGRQATAS